MGLAADGGMRWLLLVTCLIAAAGWAPLARACGILPAPYLTIDSIQPTDGVGDVPLDSVIALNLKAWPNDGSAASTVRVRLVSVTSGEVVPGALELGNGSTPRFWRPEALLQPNTRYRVEVTVESTSLPQNVLGADEASATFTTSARVSAPLRLDGSLQAKLRAGTVPVTDCNHCNEPCTKLGERPALLADVIAPSVSGGVDAIGYDALLVLSYGAAPMFNGPGEGYDAAHSLEPPYPLRPQPGATNELMSVEIPHFDPVSDICLGWNVWDPAGHSQSATPLCFKAAELEQAFAELDAANPSQPPTPALPDAGAQPSTPSDDDEDGGSNVSIPKQPRTTGRAVDAGAPVSSAPNESSAAGAMMTDEPPPAVHVQACAVAAIGGRPVSRRAAAWLALLSAPLCLRRKRSTRRALPP